MSVGLIFTTLLGLVMAFRFVKNKTAMALTLAAGIAISNSAALSRRGCEEAVEITWRAHGRATSLATMRADNRRDCVISLPRSSCCSSPRRAPGPSCCCHYRRRCSRNGHGKSNFRRNASLLSDDVSLAAVGWPDASLATATSPLRLQRLTMLEKKFATSANWSLEKRITYRKPILGTTSFNLNTKP